MITYVFDEHNYPIARNQKALRLGDNSQRSGRPALDPEKRQIDFMLFAKWESNLCR